jgi:hypothetical protein
MKKTLVLVGLLVALGSCSVDKELISKSELVKWNSKNDTIYYDTKPVAYYDHSEYELNPGHGKHAKPIQELSIIQFNFDVKTDELIKFVHTLHPRQKVEVVVPRH